MENKINTRDIEAISAYLDDELKPRERARLEARLQAEPRLRTALDELEQTRTLLRSVPRIRAPRNFTLGPEFARQRSFRFQIFPSLQFASALAAILLVLFVAGDVFGVIYPSPAFTTAQVTAPEAALESADSEQLVEKTLPAEAPMAAEPLLEESVAEPAAEGEAAPAEVTEVVVEMEVAAEAAVEERAMGTGEAELAPAAPLETLTAEEIQQASPPTFSMQGTEMLTQPAPEDQQLQSDAYPPPEAPEAQLLETRGGFPVPGLRLIEILLGVFVLVTGAAALALRRRISG